MLIADLHETTMRMSKLCEVRNKLLSSLSETVASIQSSLYIVFAHGVLVYGEPLA